MVLPADQVVPDSIKLVERFGRFGVEVGLSFIDPAIGVRVANSLRSQKPSSSDIKLLLESPVMYESVRPFFEAIQSHDPRNLPMAQYIKHATSATSHIGLPIYSRSPGYFWNLKVLSRSDTAVSCFLLPSDNKSIASARRVLHTHGILDPR